MPDQSAEATLKYILDSGISAVELMGGPVETLCRHSEGRGAAAGRRRRPAAAAAADAAGRRPRFRRGAKTGKWDG